MSRRLCEKRNVRARNVVALLAKLRESSGGWGGMACSYGVHDFEPIGSGLAITPGEHLQRCRRCGAVYFRPDVATATAAGPSAVDGLQDTLAEPPDGGSPASPAVEPDPLRPGT